MMPQSPPMQGRRRFLTLGAAALAAPFLARPGVAAVHPFGGRAFGTAWRVSLPARSGAERLTDTIAAFLARTDRMMSPWRADSELSLFNAAPAGGVPVSAETAQVAATALRLAKASGGAFDPSVGPLVARWGFGPINGAAEPDWHALGAGDRGLEKTRASATLDLCGLAKGWALDGIGSVLKRAGHSAFLIDLGGELIAEGTHPDGRPWQVGVEDPRPAVAGLAARIALDRGAIATSGRKTNGYTLGTRRYSHIIDPTTQEPVAGQLDQVSVIARDAMTADGWATALLAAGENGPALAETNRIAALFLYHDARGVRRRTTGAFARHLV